MTIEQRIAEIERQLAEVKAEMKPEPTGLVEAVEELLKAMPYKIDGCCSFGLNDAINSFHLALAREKRIAEKREAVINVAREQAYINRRHGVQSKFTEAVDALDEECAK